MVDKGYSAATKLRKKKAANRFDLEKARSITAGFLQFVLVK